MKNLLISATDELIVEVFEDGKKVASDVCISSSKAEDILKIVSAKLGCDGIDDVDNILLNVGPGSFTGIRASMALVFGLTRSGKINIVPFTTFDALALNKVSSNTALVVAGFSNFVYAKYMFEGQLHMECIEAEKIAEIVRDNGLELIVSSKVPKEKFENLGVQAKISEFDAEHVNNLFESKKLEKRKLEPLYLRASQAELAKQEKEKNGKLKR